MSGVVGRDFNTSIYRDLSGSAGNNSNPLGLNGSNREPMSVVRSTKRTSTVELMSMRQNPQQYSQQQYSQQQYAQSQL